MYKKESGIFLKGLSSGTDEGLEVGEAPYLQKTFANVLVGPPNSGKTCLIGNLISHEKLYLRKFHKLIYICPTQPEFAEFDHWWPDIKLSWLFSAIEAQNEQGIKDGKRRQLLVIFDDVVSSLKSLQNDPQLTTLFYNRRHLRSHVHIHFLITTQKWTMLPPRIRNVITGVFLFSVTQSEWKSVKKELPIENLAAVEKQLALIWDAPKAFVFFNLTNKKIFSVFDELLL